LSDFNEPIKVRYTINDDGETVRTGDNISDWTRAIYTKFFQDGEVVYKNFGPEQKRILENGKAVNMDFFAAFGEALKSMLNHAQLTEQDEKNMVMAMWYQVAQMVYQSDRFLFRQFAW